MVEKKKHDQPVMAYPLFSGVNQYLAGEVPKNAILGDPMGAPIQQTFFRDTPAPFHCVFCGNSGVTFLRSKPSPAAVMGCVLPMMLGVCFLCPAMDCLWHKYHYCQICKQKVADFEKSDPFALVDLPQWKQKSFALPA